MIQKNIFDYRFFIYANIMLYIYLVVVKNDEIGISISRYLLFPLQKNLYLFRCRTYQISLNAKTTPVIQTKLITILTDPTCLHVIPCILGTALITYVYIKFHTRETMLRLFINTQLLKEMKKNTQLSADIPRSIAKEITNIKCALFT